MKKEHTGTGPSSRLVSRLAPGLREPLSMPVRAQRVRSGGWLMLRLWGADGACVMSSDIKTIRGLEVPLIVQLGERSMTVAELLALAPGSIIEIPKPADDELDLLINNQRIGVGTAVKVGENFGLRVSAIGSPEAIAEAIEKRLEEKFNSAA